MVKHMHTWGLSVFRGGFVSVKEFKTIDEQIEILKSRKLTITDEVTAKTFLRRNNYYRVSGYSLTLRDHDEFFEGASFQNIIDIYDFDAALRHILLESIEKIEIAIKSIFAYKFSEKYGALGYLKSSNFTNCSEYLRIINKANEQKEKRLSHEAFLKHFMEDCDGDIPFWAYVDLLTIADISMLYQISHHDIQDTVAGMMRILPSNRVEILGKYMHGMTILRNLCAHGSRLYNRLFITKPSLNSKEKKLLRTDENGIVDNAHLFGYILNMKRLLSSDDFNEMKDRIVELTEKIPFVSMRYYGFPDNWKDVI